MIKVKKMRKKLLSMGLAMVLTATPMFATSAMAANHDADISKSADGKTYATRYVYNIRQNDTNSHNFIISGTSGWTSGSSYCKLIGNDNASTIISGSGTTYINAYNVGQPYWFKLNNAGTSLFNVKLTAHNVSTGAAYVDCYITY